MRGPRDGIGLDDALALTCGGRGMGGEAGLFIVAAEVGLLTNGEVKATWLILPVVIRSSQRLSHACLSITFLL